MDNKSKADQRKRSSAVRFFNAVMVGVGIGMAIIMTLLILPVLREFVTCYMAQRGFGYFMLYWFGGIVLAFAVLFLQIVIHEAGHLAGGLASGYGFVSFRVGSYMIYKDNDGFHFGRFSVAGTGGQCLLEPPAGDIADADKMPYKVYLAGGTAANIAVMIISVVVLWIFTLNVFWTFVFAMLVLTGLIMAVMNGVPMYVGSMPNDGRSISDMNHNGAARRGMWLQLKINALYSRGKLMHDMPDEWFSLPEGADLADYSNTAIAVAEASRRVECHDFQGAYDLLHAIYSEGDRVIGLYRREVECELMFVAVMLRRPRAEIDQIFKPETVRYARIYSRYMISRVFTIYIYERFVLGHEAEAAKAAEAVQRTAEHYPIKGEAASCLELMQWVQTLKDEDYGVD